MKTTRQAGGVAGNKSSRVSDTLFAVGGQYSRKMLYRAFISGSAKCTSRGMNCGRSSRSS